MTSWLVSRFVPDHTRTQDPQVRAAYGTVASVVGGVVNLLLAAAKFMIGLLSGSLAVVADAANNLSDAASSIVTFVTMRLSQKPVDSEHPFGHGRMEYIGSLAVGALIVGMGFTLFKDAIGAIWHPQALSASWTALAVLAASILVKLWLYFFYRRTGSAIGSGTLLAAAKDSMGDVLSSSAVLVSVGLNLLFGWMLDGWIGLAVAAIVLKAGFDVCSDTIDSLLGGRPDPQKAQQIRELLLAREGILGLHDLIVHDYGPGRCVASIHAEVSAHADIVEIHELIDDAEREIVRKLKIPICIHMDPIVTGDSRTEHVRSLMETFLRGVDPSLSLHDFRMVPGEEQINLIFDCVLPAGYQGREALLGALAAYARTLDERYHLVVEFDTDYL